MIMHACHLGSLNSNQVGLSEIWLKNIKLPLPVLQQAVLSVVEVLSTRTRLV